MKTYIKNNLVSDLLAGLTVSFAALSLGAAFGIMSGRGAFAGMLGAAIIPIITSIFGGTRIQASGPTAPMTAVTALLVAKAYDGFNGDKHFADEYITLVLLMTATFIILAGVLKLGKYIRLVPQVVILGFMNGIGILIWVDQVEKLFGLGGHAQIQGNVFYNLLIAASTLLLIYLIPFTLRKLKVPAHVSRFVPSIFVAIVAVTSLTTYFGVNVQHVSLGQSYGSLREFIGIVIYDLPLNKEIFRLDMMKAAFPLALQLSLLAYLDSLLTSLVIDKMVGEKTETNKELMAQGLANGIAGLLQGIPGAQATIRSVLLIKEGAQTRMAGIFVGIFALLGFLVFGQLISLIASAVFVGILLKAGLDVLDRDFLMAFYKYHWIKKKERNIQLLLIVYTSAITVLVDLNVAVLTATAFYYAGKKFFHFTDAEDDFAQIHAAELHGQSIEE
jgi:sulfate permease, SulP family